MSGASGEETAGAAGRLRVLPFPWQPGGAERRDWSADLENLHDRRRSAADEEEQGRTQMWGPSGAPIWTSPAIDVRRNALYVTTGDNYSDPPTSTSDAFMAFDLEFRQDSLVPPDDGGRRLEHGLPPAGHDELPRFERPRFRFRVSADSGDARRTAGARSLPGRNPASSTPIDPDREGAVLWQERVGKGGINGGVQWGSAADQSNVYVALSDIGRIRYPEQRGDQAGSESWRRHVRAASRYRRASLVHAAAGVRRQRTLQSRAIGRGQRHSRRCVFRIGRRASARVLRHATAPSCGTSTRSAPTRR